MAAGKRTEIEARMIARCKVRGYADVQFGKVYSFRKVPDGLQISNPAFEDITYSYARFKEVFTRITPRPFPKEKKDAV